MLVLVIQLLQRLQLLLLQQVVHLVTSPLMSALATSSPKNPAILPCPLVIEFLSLPILRALAHARFFICGVILTSIIVSPA